MSAKEERLKGRVPWNLAQVLLESILKKMISIKISVTYEKATLKDQLRISFFTWKNFSSKIYLRALLLFIETRLNHSIAKTFWKKKYFYSFSWISVKIILTLSIQYLDWMLEPGGVGDAFSIMA